MTKGLPYIIDALFGKTELKDVSLEELHELVKEFPSFNAAHFLLSKKLILQNVDSAETEINRTALYFNNAFWLRTLLDEDRKEAEHPAPVVRQADLPDLSLTDTISPDALQEQLREEYQEDGQQPVETEQAVTTDEPESAYDYKNTETPIEHYEVSSAKTDFAHEPSNSQSGGEAVTTFDELLRKYKVEETPLSPSPDTEEKIFSREESSTVGQEGITAEKNEEPTAEKQEEQPAELKEEPSAEKQEEQLAEPAAPEPERIAEPTSREEVPADTREIVNEYGIFEEEETADVADEDLLEGLDIEENKIPEIENKTAEPVRVSVEHDFEAFDRPIGRNGDGYPKETDEMETGESGPDTIPEVKADATEETAQKVLPFEQGTEETVSEFHETESFENNSGTIAEELYAAASGSEVRTQQEFSGHDADSISENKPDEMTFESAENWSAGSSAEENAETGSPRPLPHFDTAKAGAIVYTPYHMVDYFASQGIKLVLDENPPDQLGRQLKSFTDWLKVLKKSPVQASVGKTDDREVEKIRHFAAHSLEDRDILTESMAEVLAKQGMYENAIALYQKLSLIYPPKSAYFASRIEQLKASLP